MTTETHYRCDATIGQEPTDWGFAPIRCRQVVATRGYWARTEPWENTGHFVAYCPKPGHQADVRRRFPEVDPPMPTFLHEDPAFTEPDPIDQYKSYTDAGWTEPELREAFRG